MSGVSRDVTKHTLNIKPGEKRQAMGEELSRLLAAGFVKEVQHPDEMANPVLVPKKNRK
jgi:hypothetical protein